LPASSPANQLDGIVVATAKNKQKAIGALAASPFNSGARSCAQKAGPASLPSISIAPSWPVAASGTIRQIQFQSDRAFALRVANVFGPPYIGGHDHHPDARTSGRPAMAIWFDADRIMTSRGRCSSDETLNSHESKGI
jgi:hypothetical protein